MNCDLPPQQRDALRALLVPAHEKLQAFWQVSNSGVEISPPDEAGVEALEARYGIQIPSEFREYLLSGRWPGDGMDSEVTEWWRLDRIKSLNEEYGYRNELTDAAATVDADKCLFFADYMMWCWAWAIACGDDENRGKIIVIGGSSDRFVADNFGEFVDRYIEDPLLLY